MPTLSFSHVSFAWPDGRRVFDDLTTAVPEGLSALVGRNGIGKSTLLRLALGELTPTAGTVSTAGRLAYVPQDLSLGVDARVVDVLGVAPRVDALRAIESGSGDPAHYEVLGDDWGVEDRALAVLRGLGLESGLDRRVGHVSGGESVLLGVGAALLTDPDLLILDEPTNNLDAEARVALRGSLASRRGATLVVTHDRGMLETVDRIGELRERDDRTSDLHWYGGALGEFESARATEGEAAARAVTAAESAVARRGRDLDAHVAAAGRRSRQGEKARAQRRVVGLAADAAKNRAERTDARVRAIHEQRLAAERERLDQARAALPRDRAIRIDLPATAVPSRRLVAEAAGLVTRTGAELDALVRGPERIHVAGGNGAGKTTLVATLLGEIAPASGRASVAVPAGVLRQRLDVLDPSLSVIDNVRRRAPEASPQDVRDSLGRFQFRGASAGAPVSTLSGGERFRAALACVLLARPAPQVLVLDEPTNSLDLDSQARLLEALADFQGALLVISHDPAFVEALHPTRRWTVAAEGGPVTDEPLA